MLSDSNIIRRSLLLSFLNRYASTSMQFVSVVILARLLTPEDIGIYTVGLAIIGVAHMVRDFGIGKYIVQERELTVEKVATGLGLTICIAWSLGILVEISASYVAEFYKEEAVEKVIHVVALNFFLIPVGAMAPALLKRSMSFGTLAKINLGSTFVSVLVGIALALEGFGYMSMAWASVANVATSAILAQYYLPLKYRVFPSLKNGWKILGFGSHVVGANLAKELNDSALDLLVGKQLGFAALGFLSRGQGFVKIHDNVISKATTPVIAAHLSKRYRAGEGLDESYVSSINYLTLTSWLALGFMGLMSFELMRVLYGDQWDSAVPIASMLCLLGIIGVPTSLARSLLVSTGAVKLNFYLTVVFASLRVCLIFGLVEKGLMPMLWGFLGLGLINLLVTHTALISKYQFSIGSILSVISKNLFITTMSLIVPMYYWLQSGPQISGLFYDLMIGAFATGCSSLCLIYVTKHPIRSEVSRFTSFAVCRVRKWLAF